jgi:hypothetical protein
MAYSAAKSADNIFECQVRVRRVRKELFIRGEQSRGERRRWFRSFRSFVRFMDRQKNKSNLPVSAIALSTSSSLSLYFSACSWY